jgi:hypothetical protein
LIGFAVGVKAISGGFRLNGVKDFGPVGPWLKLPWLGDSGEFTFSS